MDNLTHSLFGLTLARTPLGRGGRAATIALVLASNAPDIDIVTTAGGAAKYLAWHRGPTHGPLGVIGLGLIVAGLVVAGERLLDRTSRTTRDAFLNLWAISSLGVVCHILMDLPTSYGTRPLSPFAWTWFTVDWMPIVDIYLLAILAAGLWFGRSAPARNATFALLLMLLNYGVRATMHWQALRTAPAVFGAQLPERCNDAVMPGAPIDHWPRDTSLSPRDSSARRCVIEIAAMPDFISPFRWRLIAQLANGYEVRAVNLLGLPNMPASNVRLIGVYYPNQWTPAVAKASTAPIARTFLGFSRFPSVRSVIDENGVATVIWTDLRFVIADNPASPRQRTPGVFGATIRVTPNGSVVSERLGS